MSNISITLNKDSLLLENKNGYSNISKETTEKINNFAQNYKNFLNKAKTERECVKFILNKVKSLNFNPFDPSKKYNPGDKIYFINRNKAIIIATIGKNSLENGVSFLISHIDSPRIDLTPKPLFEDADLAFFKSQYYGGIKKYQWTTIPLSMHGVIVKKDETEIEVSIGENENEPIFCITDLLPHLADQQMKRTGHQLIKGDELNILIGSKPFIDNDSDENSQKNKNQFKLNVMKILHQKYGINEKDLISADLSFTPAFKARDIGFDASLVGAYGQDDRVCAYSSLKAHLATSEPYNTIVTVFTDKEEIGSDGNTGLKSRFLEYFISHLAQASNIDPKLIFSNSVCLSADVTSAFDPTWKEPFEIHNSAYINYGVSLTKYNGHRGKYDTSEASPNFLAKVIKILDDNDIIWQSGGLGKVDVGGGGTIANYIANLDVDVLDIGVPVLSMHAPYEIVSKLDLYMTYKAFYHFINRLS